jgi:hypothetical protein
MPSEEARQEYWICAKRGVRLSDVAPPSPRTCSFSVQDPAWGNIASFVYLVVVYISIMASSAPGQRAAACAPSIGIRDGSIQPSGLSASKVMTADQ